MKDPPRPQNAPLPRAPENDARMTRRSLPFRFTNAQGQKLAGILDMPAEDPLFFGVFAPCFTCTKESHAAAKVCREMAEHGAAMLRFDITGLGASEGDFSRTNFTTRIHDIVAACHALSAAYRPPALLIGHSISGTASLSAARHLPFLQAVATLGAPRDPAYVIEKFRKFGQMEVFGDRVEVVVAGRRIAFHPSFVEDMLAQRVAEDTATIIQKLFVFHAPHDDIVSFANAQEIFDRARCDRELVTLDDGATHLFENRKDDAVSVAETLLDWFRTHLK